MTPQRRNLKSKRADLAEAESRASGASIPASAETAIRADAAEPLVFTGERYHPEILGEIRQEHMHRYAWALDAVADLDVVDIASGEGFGTAMLATRARSVVGIDLSAAAVRHAAARYGDSVSFLHADAAAVPLPDGCADAVISFETIEHVADPERTIAEIRRILRPDGFLIMSSPNTRVYSERQGHVNAFHRKEFTTEEFEALLRGHFPAVHLFGQRLSVVSSLLDSDANAGSAAGVFRDNALGTIEKSAREIPMTMYSVATAAQSPDLLPQLAPSFLVTAGYDVYWQVRDELARLTRENRFLIQREHARLLLASEFFSTSYYLLQRQVPWRDDLALATDYLAYGEKEGLRPSPLFDPAYYLAAYPDVAAAQMSPLLHYITSGRGEGRMPQAPETSPPTAKSSA
ncbi:MAG: class I SAM-dependent methyltransferase [Pseudorhodoplanes sp.]